MTKAELIARVASRKDLPRTLTKKAYAKIVDAVFTEVGDYFIRARASLANPPRLSYPGFGTFTKRRRNSRTVLPSASESAGAVVRRRNGLASRTRSSGCPITRGSSAAI